MKMHNGGSATRGQSGMTLVEFMIATGVASMLMVGAGALTLYGARGFAGIFNYVDLDSNSRITMDAVSRAVRAGTALVSYQTNASQKILTLTNANDSTTAKLTYNVAAGTLVFDKTGQASTTLLTQCDAWDAQLYSRVPILSSTNITFYGATNGGGQFDASFVKLINMRWKCSRSVVGTKLNTESVQTAQIVLRNKAQ